MPDTGAAGAAKLINRHVEETTGPKLDEAAVVVSGGRGLGEQPKYEMIETLAKLLKGAPGASRAIVDAGLKALSVDSGMPKVVGHADASFVRAADEHGRIEIAAGGQPFKVGEKIRLIPGHCDPTVNLHDWFVCIRNSRVESLWPVSARGAVF